jgi:hypothetical protein
MCVVGALEPRLHLVGRDLHHLSSSFTALPVGRIS